MDTTVKELRKAMQRYWRAQGRLEVEREAAFDAIRAASASGMSLRAIGELTELSHQRIAQILRPEEEARRQRLARLPERVRRTIETLERTKGDA